MALGVVLVMSARNATKKFERRNGLRARKTCWLLRIDEKEECEGAWVVPRNLRFVGAHLGARGIKQLSDGSDVGLSLDRTAAFAQ